MWIIQVGRALPIEIPFRSRTWQEPKETTNQLPSGALSFPLAKGRGGDVAADFARRLSDRVDRSGLDPWQIEDLLAIGKVAGQEAIKYFEALMGATEDGRVEMHGELTAGNSRLF